MISSVALIAVFVGQFVHATDDTGAAAPRADDPDMYREIIVAEPHLPDRPARRENISDEEVREVQQVTSAVYPDSIVVISSVTDGCACEEGRQCSAQVGLTVNRNNTSHGLILSKIGGHWMLSETQRWWLRYAAFALSHPQPTGRDDYQAWLRQRQVMLLQYPACPVPAADWRLVRTNQSGSTFVDVAHVTVSASIRRVNFKSATPPPKLKTNFVRHVFTINLEAFDCQDHRYRTDKTMAYYSNGIVQRQAVEDPVLWRPVRTEAMPGSDLEMVCNLKVASP